MASPQQQGGGGLDDLCEVMPQLPSVVTYQSMFGAGVMSQRLCDLLNSHNSPYHG